MKKFFLARAPTVMESSLSEKPFRMEKEKMRFFIKNNLRYGLTVLTFAGVFSAEPGPLARAGTSSGAGGDGSPASDYCAKLGRSVPIVGGVPSGGGAAICEFNDGALIEEWTLYRAKRGSGLPLAITAFMKGAWHGESGPKPTWADQNCVRLGGRKLNATYYLRPSESVDLCQFPDNSTIEAWTLFAGASQYSESGRILTHLPDIDHPPQKRTPIQFEHLSCIASASTYDPSPPVKPLTLERVPMAAISGQRTQSAKIGNYYFLAAPFWNPGQPEGMLFVFQKDQDPALGLSPRSKFVESTNLLVRGAKSF